METHKILVAYVNCVNLSQWSLLLEIAVFDLIYPFNPENYLCLQTVRASPTPASAYSQLAINLFFFLFFLFSSLFLCHFISFVVSPFVVHVHFVWLIPCRHSALRVAFIVNTNANRLFHNGYITKRWTFKWHNHPYWRWPPILRYIWGSKEHTYRIAAALDAVSSWIGDTCAMCIFNRYDSRKQ